MEFVLEKNLKLFYFLAASVLIAIFVVFYLNTQEVLRKSDNVL